MGGLRSRPFAGKETFETLAGEAGLRANVDTGPINHAVNVNYSINDRTYNQTVRTRSAMRSPTLFSGTSTREPTNIPEAQLRHVVWPVNDQRKSSKASAFPIRCRCWNKRIQLTVGVRNQTAGSAGHELSARRGLSRPLQETSVWTPAYAIVVKPVENISLYANYIEGLQTPVVVTGISPTSAPYFHPARPHRLRPV